MKSGLDAILLFLLDDLLKEIIHPIDILNNVPGGAVGGGRTVAAARRGGGVAPPAPLALCSGCQRPLLSQWLEL